MRKFLKKESDIKPSRLHDNPLAYGIFIFLSIIYLEVLFRVFINHDYSVNGPFFTLLFSVPFTLLIVILSSLGSKFFNRTISFLCLFLITLLFCIQIVYYPVFSTYFSLFSLIGAGDVLTLKEEVVDGIIDARLPLFLASLPLFFWLLRARRWVPRRRLPAFSLVQLGGSTVLAHILIVLVINGSNAGIVSTRYLYNDSYIINLTASRFGILTNTRLDLQNLILPSAINIGKIDESDIYQAEPADEYNVLTIPFDTLIAEESNGRIRTLHDAFNQRLPTAKNEYSGMFEGKNLIWICAESWSRWTLQPELTPTLCKLADEGFVFTNYYNPRWGVSTSDGEFTTTTGLLPKAGVWSYLQTAANAMPFAMGNQLNRLGYACRAYHDYSHDYYRRDLTHPNMGYEFIAIGNGLEITNQWPPSDLEMMEVSIPSYTADKPFHTYYMTMSGHLSYNSSNAMALKHEAAIENLPYSDTPRYYLACNIEFDLAVQYLLEELEAAGVLDDTLLVISNDHYPYGLALDEIAELNGIPIESDFDLYKSSLIIWNSTMDEHIEIDKPCDALDIMPTISNLLGIEYDSRLIMGRDILADENGLVVLADHSWLTDEGRYEAATDTFTANPGVEVGEDYIAKVMKLVDQLFIYSTMIINFDYYASIKLPD